MIQPEVAAALIAVAGGVAVVAARDGRVVAIGLLVAMVAAPFASSPQPHVLVVVFRILGASLAAYLLVAAARSRSIESEGSRIGVTAEIALAAAAFSVGWFVAPVKPLTGPLAAQAAGIAMVTLAILPLIGRDAFRVGAGAAVLAIGGSLLLQAWAASTSSVGQVVLTALLVGLAGATSLLISPLGSPAQGSGATAEQRLAGAPSRVTELEAAEGAGAASRALDIAPSAETVPGVEAGVVQSPGGRASAGPVTADGGASGATSRRTTSKKAPRATAQAPAVSMTPAQSRPRASTIRTSPFLGLRSEGWTDQAKPAGEGTPAQEPAPESQEFASEPSTEPTSPPTRMTRLRPREPRP